MIFKRILVAVISGLALAGCSHVGVQTAAEPQPAAQASNTVGKIARSPVHDLVTKVAQRKQVPVAIAHAIVRQEIPPAPGPSGGRGGAPDVHPEARAESLSGSAAESAADVPGANLCTAPAGTIRTTALGAKRGG